VLPYTRQLGATHLIDFATLTGAMERALGDFYAGVFANDSEWRTLVVESGEASGDHAWPWPLHSRYRRFVDSDYADLKNSNIRSQGVPVLAAEFLSEFAGELDREHRFPYDLVAELAELGLMGMTVPEDYGGAGADTLSYALAIEELTRIDSSVAITVAAHHSLGTLPIFYFGNEEQKREWL